MGRIGVHPPDSLFQDSVSCGHYGHHPPHQRTNSRESLIRTGTYYLRYIHPLRSPLNVRQGLRLPIPPPPGIYCVLVDFAPDRALAFCFTYPIYSVVYAYQLIASPPHTIEYFKELKRRCAFDPTLPLRCYRPIR